jgi:hypothetical protein
MSSTYPDVWKLAEVIPLLKEGDREVSFNNRPLHVSDCIKNMRKGGIKPINRFFIKNESLSTGNKKSHSTETLNIFITDQILQAMDQQKVTALI